VVVAGSFDRDEIVREVRRHARGARTVPAAPAFALPVRTHVRAAHELHVLGWPLRLESPEDTAIARVLAIVAERALWTRFRETGVTYAFTVGAFRSPGIELFIASIPIRNTSGAGVSRFIEAVFEEIRLGRFDDAQLDRARAIALGDMAWADEDAGVVAAELALGGVAWHGRAVDEALRRLDRAAFVQRVATWLTAERSIALHFGPTEQARQP
jgi:hypothetical protein